MVWGKTVGGWWNVLHSTVYKYTMGVVHVWGFSWKKLAWEFWFYVWTNIMSIASYILASYIKPHCVTILSLTKSHDGEENKIKMGRVRTLYYWSTHLIDIFPPQWLVLLYYKFVSAKHFSSSFYFCRGEADGAIGAQPAHHVRYSRHSCFWSTHCAR